MVASLNKGLSGLLGTQTSYFFFPSWEEVILREGNICSVLWCNTKPWPALLFGGMGEEWVCSWGLLLPTPSACSQHSKELQQTPCSRKAAQQIPRLTAALKDNKKTKIFQSITTLCLSFQWLWGNCLSLFQVSLTLSSLTAMTSISGKGI